MANAMGQALSADKLLANAFIQNDMAHILQRAISEAVKTGDINPDLSTHILLPERIANNAQRFLTAFREGTRHMYAVKANPDNDVLRVLFDSGVTSFDVASGAEIMQIRALFGKDATLYYMHPKKSDTDIDLAFREQVKGFVADSEHSLGKIINHASFDPAHHAIIIRIQLPKRGEDNRAALPLDDKFGAGKALAIALLQTCKERGVKDIGMSFHVGSQMLNPLAYGEAIDLVASYAVAAGVELSSMDVGGGFPAFEAYPHIDKPVFDLSVYAHHVEFALARNNLKDVNLITEPGRALVADAGYLVTRVMEVDKARNAVYLNDGTYGSLFDAGKSIGFAFPVAVMDMDDVVSDNVQPMTIQGVTCDSCDKLDGQWLLPLSIEENDFIVFGLHGAYSQAMRSDFNGFGKSQTIIL